MEKENEKNYTPPVFDGDKVIPGHFNEKIKDFQKKCIDIHIPLKEIKILQNSLSLKKGKLHLIGGAVRSLILNKSFKNQHPDLVTDLSLNDLTKCLKKSNIKVLPLGINLAL